MREVEVRIHKWCDLCWLDGEQKTESTHSFAIGAVESITRGPLAKHMDTCEMHAKSMIELCEIVTKLPAFVAEKATARPKVAATAAPATTLFDPDTPHVAPSSMPANCPVCSVRCNNKQALVTHVWKLHAASERPSAPMVCPDCGERGQTAQGSATHRRFEHGYDALEEALQCVPNYQAPREITA